MKKLLIILFLVFMPFISHGVAADLDRVSPTSQSLSCTMEGSGSTSKIAGLFDWVTCVIVRGIVLCLTVLCLITFMWGVVNFIKNSGAPAERAKGQQLMFWGILGLAMIFMVWGVVGLVINTFAPGSTVSIPVLPTR